VFILYYLGIAVTSVMAAGNIQYVPEILVIRSRGNSVCIVNRPTNFRQKYWGRIPGWIAIFLSVRACMWTGKESSLLTNSLSSRDKDELMVSLNF